MIYELLEIDVAPRMLPKVEAAMAAAVERRGRASSLAASWRTEIGPFNQIIQAWPYDDLGHFAEARRETANSLWPPPEIAPLIRAMRSDIVSPFPFSPRLEPGRIGPIFDLHAYIYPHGALPDIVRTWEHALPDRLRYGPICALWSVEVGALNTFIHIVPYRSLEDYTRTRERVAAGGNWPPSAVDVREGGPGYELIAQASKILVPSPYSPVQ